MKIASIFARYLLGLIFGLNGFLHCYPPAAPGESARDSVSCLRQRVAFCRILLRDSIARWAAVAFGLLRATCADSVGGGTLQHPCVSPDACAGEHSSGSGGLGAVGCWSSFSTPKASRESSARSLRRSHELRRSNRSDSYRLISNC